MVVANYGVSFGIDIPGLTLASVLLLIFLAYWWWKEKSWPLMVVFVGGLLNLMDRLMFGFVRDYWKIPGTGLYNNINDWLIFVGLVIYLYQKWRQKRSK